MLQRSFLNQNLEFLKKYQRPVYNWLGQVNPEQSIASIEQNDKGFLDWRLDNNEFLLRSFPIPLIYKKWAELELEDKSVSIVLGTNLGYGLNYLLLNSVFEHKVLVIEPSPKMLSACLSQTDYTRFIQGKRLFFLPPSMKDFEEVLNNLEGYFFWGRIHFRVDLPSLQISSDYANWSKLVQDSLNSFKLSMATFRRSQDELVENELNNYSRARQDGSIFDLTKNRPQQFAAAILGAGPSLERFAPFLKSHQDNLLQVTALQTLPALQQLGLTPHFCMAIDFHESMLRVFDRLDHEKAKDVPLIYSPKVQPEILNRYPGPTLPVWTKGGLGTYLRKDMELVLDTSGNVSIALIRLLRAFGIFKFVLAGQDFSWSGKYTHQSGHHAGISEFSFDPKRHVKLRNKDKEEIISTRVYLAAAHELGKEISKSGADVYNLYGGGVKISGAVEVDFKELKEKLSFSGSEEEVGFFIRSLLSCQRPVPWPDLPLEAEKWSDSLKIVLRKLDRMFKKNYMDQQSIHNKLRELNIFLNQNPLYQPYIYNEILDLSEFIQARKRYYKEDLNRIKQVLKKVRKKVEKVDKKLGKK